jgi:hypothetical protein
MPSLDGATRWLNSEPLGPAELRGQVVLVNSGAGAGNGLGTVGAHDIMVSSGDEQDAREILHKPR